MTGRKRGFTLIELLIVIGIIALLVVVLAVAVFPAIAKSDHSATKTLLTSVATGLPSDMRVLSIEKFKKDAGPALASAIDPNPEKASSQMLLFYVAPGLEAWQNSKIYGGSNYNPQSQPESFSEFTQPDASGRMPYLIDSWSTPLQYFYDKGAEAGYIMSAGPDQQWKTDDDLIFDPKTNSVKERSEMKK